MKIKIGDETFDGNDVPILLILSQDDKDNIKSMPDGYFKYCSYPEKGFTEEEIRKFMNLKEPVVSIAFSEDD